MRTIKTALQRIIEQEGNNLCQASTLLSGNTKQAREILEQIIDHALKQLYAPK